MAEPESDGYVRPITPEQVAQWERDYDEAERRQPRPQAPPMANVALALELSAANCAIRSGSFLGTTARFHPTSYFAALQLLAWEEKLAQLRGLAQVMENLPDFQACYQHILAAALPLVESLEGAPLTPASERALRRRVFEDATAEDFAGFLKFLLDPGDERTVRQPLEDGPLYRYDAAHYLYAYLDRFGAIPGMVVLEEGRPMPASWRHFTKACSYLRRVAAEQALAMYAATAEWSDPAPRQKWFLSQRLDAGHW